MICSCGYLSPLIDLLLFYGMERKAVEAFASTLVGELYSSLIGPKASLRGRTGVSGIGPTLRGFPSFMHSFRVEAKPRFDFK
jgi:hypothetical protein